ncbi:hypothetical protein PtB15_1B433 [Puccinia triticina]|nr:hypothetical protein PtB15_1B433 [Puccinia triticina]
MRSGIVCFHDWGTGSLVQRIEVEARDVFCSASGEHVAIASEELLGILRFNQQAYSEFLAKRGELGDNGVEAAIDLLHELPEVVQTQQWVGDCLIFQLGVPEERSPDYGGFSNNMDNLILREIHVLSEQEWVI